jgi:hypothetical protein
MNDDCPELNEDVPVLSLASGFVMALVIAIFRPGKRRTQQPRR